MPKPTIAHPEVDRGARTGPIPLDPEDKRVHCVSVRLTSHELAQLDIRRGRMQRGKCLRVALFNQLPRTLPDENVSAWVELGQLEANIRSALNVINRANTQLSMNEFLQQSLKVVKSLRQKLIGMQQ